MLSALLHLPSTADSLNARTPRGDTPLILAVNAKNIDSCLLLLAAGADVNACDKRGYTAMHSAARRDFVSVVPELLSRGASPSALTSDFARTPLHVAAVNSSPAVAALLVAVYADADIMARDSLRGDTALHHAVKVGGASTLDAIVRGSQCVETLLASRNDDGLTASDLMGRMGHAHLAPQLRRAAASARRYWLLRLCALLEEGRAAPRGHCAAASDAALWARSASGRPTTFRSLRMPTAAPQMRRAAGVVCDAAGGAVGLAPTDDDRSLRERPRLVAEPDASALAAAAAIDTMVRLLPLCPLKVVFSYL